MKRIVVSLALGVACLTAAGALIDDAHAIPPFKKEFDAMYVKAGTDFAKKVEEIKCNLCHVGTNKKDRNAYGEQLSKLLDRMTDQANPQKIQDALKKVAEMKSKPDDDESPTFAALIEEGKLPGGEEDDSDGQ